MRAIFGFFAISILICAYGWIDNIVKLTHILDGQITGMLVARIVGVFVVPLGVILGFSNPRSPSPPLFGVAFLGTVYRGGRDEQAAP